MTSTQFGSYCDTVEYESDVHTLSLGADYQATEKLKLNSSFVYNNAKDSWDWKFGDRPSLSWLGSSLNIPGAIDQTNYDTSAQNNQIDGYSDLSYEQFEITMGGTYQFTEAFYSTASATYDVFKSKQDYVYEDEDGQAYYAYLGFGYRF